MPRIRLDGDNTRYSRLQARRLYQRGTGAAHVAAGNENLVLTGGAKGPTPQGIDFGACYDSKRDRIYVGGGAYRGPYGKDEGYLYVYDVKSNTWSNRPNKQNAMAWPGANYCCVHYDTASDRVLCIFGWCMDKRGISVYNPENDSWEAPLELPEKIVSRWCVHGFYASEVNAHFIYTALDSDDRGTMWVYRYKSAAE